MNSSGATHFKYESPLIGKANVFKRVEGQWVKIKGSERVSDLSAVVVRTIDEVTDRDYPASNLKKGDEYQEYYKWVLDFAVFDYTRTWYRTKMDGSPLVPGKAGHDRAKPETTERRCKKPDESWQDRYG